MPSITRTGTMILLAALAVAACAKPQGQAEPPTIISEVGASPSPSPTLAAPAPAPPAGYPDTAEKYAKAVVQAWKAGHLDNLGDLTTAQVHEQLIEIPGPPNMSWTFIFCDGAAGSHHCRFFNGDGDVLTLRIANSLLGKAHATNHVKLEPTTYPKDGIDYAKALMAAWRDGNKPRMLLLSKPHVVDALLAKKAPLNPKLVPSDHGGAGLLIVEVTASGGFALEIHVGTTLLGGPHAVVGLA